MEAVKFQRLITRKVLSEVPFYLNHKHTDFPLFRVAERTTRDSLMNNFSVMLLKSELLELFLLTFVELQQDETRSHLIYN